MTWWETSRYNKVKEGIETVLDTFRISALNAIVEAAATGGAAGMRSAAIAKEITDLAEQFKDQFQCLQPGTDAALEEETKQIRSTVSKLYRLTKELRGLSIE